MLVKVKVIHEEGSRAEGNNTHQPQDIYILPLPFPPQAQTSHSFLSSHLPKPFSNLSSIALMLFSNLSSIALMLLLFSSLSSLMSPESLSESGRI